MDTYECDGSCVHDEDEWCGAESPSGDYRCTRLHGHTGNHVACDSEYDEPCNLESWENKRSKPVVRPEWAGPITITIGEAGSGAVIVDIPEPGTLILRVDERGERISSTPLSPEDLKRLIRALVMAANLQRPDNSVDCGECEGSGGYILDADSIYPVQRCDTCQRFASDFEAWLSLIPDETRLDGEDEE